MGTIPSFQSSIDPKADRYVVRLAQIDPTNLSSNPRSTRKPIATRSDLPNRQDKLMFQSSIDPKADRYEVAVGDVVTVIQQFQSSIDPKADRYPIVEGVITIPAPVPILDRPESRSLRDWVRPLERALPFQSSIDPKADRY